MLFVTTLILENINMCERNIKFGSVIQNQTEKRIHVIFRRNISEKNLFPLFNRRHRIEKTSVKLI